MKRYYVKNDEGQLLVTEKYGKPVLFIDWARVWMDAILALILLVSATMAGCPVYNVWQQGLKGEAELRRAEQNRQIAIQEALATEESALSYAQAEITRAEGVAEANRIIQDGLGGPDGYLRYLWIQNLPNGRTVYIPTEAGMPITEAGRVVNENL